MTSPDEEKAYRDALEMWREVLHRRRVAVVAASSRAQAESQFRRIAKILRAGGRR